MQQREVRLRPECAEVYPEIDAGVWLSATGVAELLVQRARQARALNVRQRTLDPECFDFRGGSDPVPRPPGARTRSTDSPVGAPELSSHE